MRYLRYLTSIILCLSFVACRPDNSENKGRLIIWHVWEEPESNALQAIINNFTSLFPEVTVSVQEVPWDDLIERFEAKASAGLGPDIILGIESFIAQDLYDEGWLVNLNDFDVNLNNLYPQFVQTARLNESTLIGLPFVTFTMMQYYNKDFIQTPPKSLDEIIQIADNGHVVLIPSDFYDAYWGFTGFDGQAFTNESDTPQLAIAQSDALERWLTWLLEAQAHPNIIVSPDLHALNDRFAEGQAAVHFSLSLNLLAFTEALTEQKLAVARFPMSEAQSFVEVEMAVLSQLSAEKELAVTLLNFISNKAQQQQLILANTGRSTVNNQIRLTSKLYPEAFITWKQSTEGTVITPQNEAIANLLFEEARILLPQVLEGILSPQESKDLLLLRVENAYEAQ